MQALELKVPPPAIAALIGAGMWLIARVSPGAALPQFAHELAALPLAVVGISLTIAGVFSFRQARTTMNPMQPQAAAALVRSGVYRVSRNPMYLGLLVVLLAWTAYLGTLWTALGPLGFVLYINRFQIAPEERILSAKFGASYAEYKASVRQWL
jgi:protein-S-isoprenylcysteine O-methyltransferase Ste14